MPLSKRPFSATLLAVLLFPACTSPQIDDPENSGRSMPAPLEYEEHTLENGLRIITLEDHSTPIVHLQLWYHVGGKDEADGRTGFAHLFEHLMFQGSAHLEPEEHDAIIASAGGIANAYTTDDVTVYYETVPSNFLETVLWMEADRMASLRVSQENFASEREVVKEERRYRYENPPYGDVILTLYEHAFDVHPYRHTPIGSMEDLDQATLQDVQAFWQTYYVPSNAYLVLAGDFQTRPALEWIEEYFGRIPGRASPVPRVEVEEPVHDGERRVSVEKQVPLPAYLAGYYIPEDGHPDYYPLTIASMILAEGESSRIYQSLVYASQLALQADAGADVREDPNLFTAFLILAPDTSFEAAETALEAEFQKMIEEPVRDEELVKAKNQMRSYYILGRQSAEEKAAALGHAVVIHGDASTAAGELELFLAVTAEDIMRVMAKYLRPENRTVLMVAPPEESG